MLAGLFMVTLAAASWGTWSLFLRPTGLPGTVTAPLIFLVIALAPLPFTWRLPRVRWDRATVALLLANGAFNAVNMATFFGALSHTTVAIAVLTHYLAPILVALAAPRIDGVANPAAGRAAVVALLGLVIVLEPWHAPPAGAVFGAVLGLISAVCYAGNVFTVRRVAARIGAVRAMSYHSLVAAVVLIPFAIGDLGAVTLPDLGLLLAGGATLGALSGVMFVVGLVRVGSARAAVLTFAEPLVAVAVGALAWGEALHPLAAVGGAMILGAGIHVARGSAHHDDAAARDDRDARVQ